MLEQIAMLTTVYILARRVQAVHVVCQMTLSVSLRKHGMPRANLVLVVREYTVTMDILTASSREFKRNPLIVRRRHPRPRRHLHLHLLAQQALTNATPHVTRQATKTDTRGHRVRPREAHALATTPV